jgi:hypothetical protein
MIPLMASDVTLPMDNPDKDPCRKVIEISDARYRVDPIAPGEFGTKAYRLTM